MLRRAATSLRRVAPVRRPLSTYASFEELELDMWERGAGAYADTMGSVTSQATDALLDAAGVQRAARTCAQTVYRVAPASFPKYNMAAQPSALVTPPDDLVNRVPLPPPLSVLDVATGPGFVAAAAAARGATKVVGVDTSAAMIEDARKRHPDSGGTLSFEVGDAAKLPMADSSFDVVVLGFVLLHLPDPAAALKEAYRVLKPGGTMSYSVWVPPPANKGFQILLDAIDKHGDAKVKLPGAPLPFFHFGDAANAKTALAAAGFKAESVQVQTIPCTAALTKPDDLYQMFATATARSRATLEMQTDAQREAIRSAMAAEVEGFEGAFLDGVSRSTSWLPAVAGTDAPLFDGRPSGRAPWQVPMPAVVATATK